MERDGGHVVTALHSGHKAQGLVIGDQPAPADPLFVYTVGLMLLFMRNRLPGSYLFFNATSRSCFEPKVS
jgi:hypothetical protein